MCRWVIHRFFIGPCRVFGVRLAFGSWLLQTFSGLRLSDVADFDRDTALNAGVAPSRVREWSRVHDVYFGATKFTRKEAVARRV